VKLGALLCHVGGPLHHVQGRHYQTDKDRYYRYSSEHFDQGKAERARKLLCDYVHFDISFTFYPWIPGQARNDRLTSPLRFIPGFRVPFGCAQDRQARNDRLTSPLRFIPGFRVPFGCAPFDWLKTSRTGKPTMTG